MRTRIFGHRSLAFLATLLLAPAPVVAQDDPSPDIGLEELMGTSVERVFGASKRLQPVSEAPSSVTIITAAEIERLGYRTLADILRGVRGLYVSYDRNYSYVGTRGFSLPGDYNTKVLLLIDGHRMNDSVYDQSAIGPELGVDVNTFDRVEIIRGPSSSLYGTNAFFAVINVITKTGASHPGVTVTADAGSFGARRAAITAGRRTASGVDVFLSGSMTREDGPDRLYIPAYDSPSTNFGVAEGLDDEEAAQVFGHLAVKGITLKGAYGYREKGVPTGAFATAFNHPGFRTLDQRGFLDLQWNHTMRETRLDVRTYIDRYRYDGDYPMQDGDEAFPQYLYSDYALGTWAGVDARVSRDLPWRQVVTIGGEFRGNLQQDQGARFEFYQDSNFDIQQSSKTGGVYLVDEITLHNRLLLNVGARYDNYPHFGRVTPRAAVIFRQSSSGTLKYLYGSAFRAPNAYETDYYTFFAPDGGQDAAAGLRAESISTHEVVWEKYQSDWLRWSVAVYANRLDGLIRLNATETGEFFFANTDRVFAKGGELEAEVKTRGGVQALGSYALQEATDRDTQRQLTNSPRHTMKGRVTVPTWRPDASASFELQHMSRRLTLAGTSVDPATVVNLSFVHPLRANFSLTGRVQNVLGNEYGDPGSEEHLQDAIAQNGRTMFVGLRWRLGR